MSREKIISLARELGFIPRHVELDEHWMQCVETFYYAAQREAFEAAAQIADANCEDEPYGHAKFRCVSIADAIREMAKEMK